MLSGFLFLISPYQTLKNNTHFKSYTMNQNNDQIQSFIINVSLIDPITKIIDGLNGTEYRDCDIKWLKSKMQGFIEFAAKTLGLSITAPIGDPRAEFNTLNSHVRGYFMERFTTLLNYFKSFV